MFGLLNVSVVTSLMGPWGVPNRANLSRSNTISTPHSQASILVREVIQCLFACHGMFGHCLCGWLNLTHCCMAALDSTVRFEGGFHVAGCFDIITFIEKAVHVTFEASDPTFADVYASDPTVADVFACLWFAKVVARDLDTSVVTDARERKQKITAVVTTGVV